LGDFQYGWVAEAKGRQDSCFKKTERHRDALGQVMDHLGLKMKGDFDPHE